MKPTSLLDSYWLSAQLCSIGVIRTRWVRLHNYHLSSFLFLESQFDDAKFKTNHKFWDLRVIIMLVLVISRVQISEFPFCKVNFSSAKLLSPKSKKMWSYSFILFNNLSVFVIKYENPCLYKHIIEYITPYV